MARLTKVGRLTVGAGLLIGILLAAAVIKALVQFLFQW
jgi:hypothetical protein